jgi:ubiquinone/menaquinone biosynthesis C-methylase UbiE
VSSPGPRRRVGWDGPARVRALLDPTRLDRQPTDSAGYVDLLPPESTQPRTLAQRAMHSPLLARVYEQWWRPTFTAALGLGTVAAERDSALHALALTGPERVLDVACGPGNFTRVFADPLTGDGVAVGLDVAPPMLARAVRDNAVPHAGYLRADARRLPFADGTFDAVCCYAALYLVPEPFTVLIELVRVLGPGGRIALMASYRGPHEPLRSAETLLGRLTGLRMFDRDELTGVLHSSGLMDIHQRVTRLAQSVSARRP